jgi:uncharacterized membrane protein YeiB
MEANQVVEDIRTRREREHVGAQKRSSGSAQSQKNRLIGIDAARGMALIGLIGVHILPASDPDTGEPTLAWELFNGDASALFALLAGVGLALSSGGRRPHQSVQMTATETGLMARVVLIGIVALVIAQLMPTEAPVNSILLYYAMFFLLAIPFLKLRPKALFLSAAVFALVSPVLMQRLYPVLPESSVYNHTLWHMLVEFDGVIAELLLAGTYPALTFMAFVLAGMGLGRLDLGSTRVQATIVGVGAAVAVLANLVSYLLLYVGGGYQALLSTPGMTQASLDEALVYGPGLLPDTSNWWLAIATPHSGAALAIASSLGIGMLVLGVFLMIGSKAGVLLTPLAAMGSMTLTLYSVHLLVLCLRVHYDNPMKWFLVHLGVAVVFAMVWRWRMGRGPLERPVSITIKNTRRHIMNALHEAHALHPKPYPSADDARPGQAETFTVRPPLRRMGR